MQSAFRSYHASTIARGLRAGVRTLSHARALPFSTPALGVGRGLRHAHALPHCQQRAWSQDTRIASLNPSKTVVGHRRPFGHSALDSGPHQHKVAKKDKIGPSDSASGRRDRPGVTGQDEAKKQRPRTRTRDSPAQSSRTGRLLTTPSRSLKLLIPLPTEKPGDTETIAILVHSQQPLSYLEHLIQTELSLIKDEGGHQRHPGVSFIAYQGGDNPIRPRKAQSRNATHNTDLSHEMEVEEVAVADVKGQRHPEEDEPDEEDTYSSLGKPKSNGDGEQLYVRWSPATELGDFIRDAARAGEFMIAIEGVPSGLDQIRITVPSFEERTYYLRMRLRRISARIAKLAEIKHECDRLAYRGGQRVALAGFGVLATWWLVVYKLTFATSLGWDTMEPVTYLVSLSTLMGGYLWFLYHNREISYRSALDFTINKRQRKLYQQKGMDLQLWETLIDQGNSMRREIRDISADYDTEWDEKLDERGEGVAEALKEKRNKQKGEDGGEDDSLDDKDKSKD